uniref:Uncharacterized protein n=1 Tax=OCS116 cluster bacterium TaxID=2030921 RepID=A0A2A4YPI3_9PROT
MDYLPDICLSDDLFDQNIAWLVKAIEDTKSEVTKQCCIDTLLFLNRERKDWNETQSTNQNMLDELMEKYKI